MKDIKKLRLCGLIHRLQDLPYQNPIKNSSDCKDLAFPLSPVGSVARFTVSELSNLSINYFEQFSSSCIKLC